jgi:hypothetical protein
VWKTEVLCGRLQDTVRTSTSSIPRSVSRTPLSLFCFVFCFVLRECIEVELRHHLFGSLLVPEVRATSKKATILLFIGFVQKEQNEVVKSDLINVAFNRHKTLLTPLSGVSEPLVLYSKERGLPSCPGSWFFIRSLA